MAVEGLSSSPPHLRTDEGSPSSSQKSGYGSGTSGISGASGELRGEKGQMRWPREPSPSGSAESFSH